MIVTSVTATCFESKASSFPPCLEPREKSEQGQDLTTCNLGKVFLSLLQGLFPFLLPLEIM